MCNWRELELHHVRLWEATTNNVLVFGDRSNVRRVQGKRICYEWVREHGRGYYIFLPILGDRQPSLPQPFHSHRGRHLYRPLQATSATRKSAGHRLVCRDLGPV